MATKAPKEKLTLAQRFWAKVNKTARCWLWTGALDRRGYGSFRGDHGTVKAHRVAWKLQTGESLPPEIELCHTCDTPACVRFDHLFKGSHADNMADMAAKGRGGARMRGVTHCIRGHALSAENLRTRPNGQRECKACMRAHVNAWRANRRKEAANGNG